MTRDVIIIGSGLGGLVAGAILSKEGLDVCILEKNHAAGGNLQTFEREGHAFETGMHYIGSMAPGQTLHRFFSYIGLAGRLSLRRLEMEGYDRLTFGDESKEYFHSQGWEAFEGSLCRDFPSEREAISSYVRTVRETIRTIPLYDLEHAQDYQLSPGHLQGCTSAVIASLTRDTRLQSVLAGANAVYHGAAQRTPWYLHCCVRNSLVSSSWRPAKGSGQIAEELAAIIRENGGTVMTGSEVTRLVTADGKVTAAELRDGRRLEARQFISNAHPALTFSWIDPGLLRPAFRKRIDSMENTAGFFSIYMIMKEGSTKYLNYNHFNYQSDDYFRDDIPDGQWPQTWLYYTPAHDEADGYTKIASVLSFMPSDLLTPWAGLEPGNRGRSYEDFKAERAERLLTALEKRYPGIRSGIESHYISTPLTFRDYTGTRDGSAYGILKDCRHPAASILSPRTRLPNLFLTGQNLNIHGVLGTTVSAILTCSELIGFKELVNKIAHA